MINSDKFFSSFNMTKLHLKELVKHITLEEYRPGAIIFKYGQQDNTFYKIIEGCVNVFGPNQSINNWSAEMY